MIPNARSFRLRQVERREPIAAVLEREQAAFLQAVELGDDQHGAGRAEVFWQQGHIVAG